MVSRPTPAAFATAAVDSKFAAALSMYHLFRMIALQNGLDLGVRYQPYGLRNSFYSRSKSPWPGKFCWVWAFWGVWLVARCRSGQPELWLWQAWRQSAPTPGCAARRYWRQAVSLCGLFAAVANSAGPRQSWLSVVRRIAAVGPRNHSGRGFFFATDSGSSRRSKLLLDFIPCDRYN